MNQETKVKIEHIAQSTGADLAKVSHEKSLIYARLMQAQEEIKNLNEHIEKQQAVINAYEEKDNANKG